MKEYLSTEKCIECKGRCCKLMPAPYTPKDIIRIFGDINTAIKSNIVAIDCWDDDIPLYFIRPKIVNVDNLVDFSWGGRCIHLTDLGCSLLRKNMPTFCKLLEPEKNGCSSHFKKHNSKYWAGLLWKRSKIDLTKF